MKLEDIISEEIQKRHFINESVNKINTLDTNNKRILETIEFVGQLKDKGMTGKEIENVIEEQFDWARKLFDMASGEQNVSDVGSMLRGGGVSQLKEFLIKKVLSFIGFEGVLANSIATVFSEMEVHEFLGLFRNKVSCKRHSGVVGMALTEGIVTMILSSTKTDSMAANFIRNTVFEYLKQSTIKTQIGNLICGAIFKTSLELQGDS